MKITVPKVNIKKRLFGGRINRLNFLIASLFSYFAPWLPVWGLWVIIQLIQIVFGINIIMLVPWISMVLLLLPILFGMFLYSSCLVRRHHDLNQPGWIAIIAIVVIFGIPYFDKKLQVFFSVVYFLYLFVTKGELEKNKYGNPNKKVFLF